MALLRDPRPDRHAVDGGTGLRAADGDAPALSADGQLLAFRTLVDGQSQIGVMNPGAGTWRGLTSDRTRGLAMTHDSAADGSRIFFDRQTDMFNGESPSRARRRRAPGARERGFPYDCRTVICWWCASTPIGRFSSIGSRHRAAVEPLPGAPEAGLSDDAVVVSPDGRRAYFFGRPLADTAARPQFCQLDLESRRHEAAGPMSGAEAVSLAVEPRQWRCLLRWPGRRRLPDSPHVGRDDRSRSQCSSSPNRRTSTSIGAAMCFDHAAGPAVRVVCVSAGLEGHRGETLATIRR